MAADYNLTNQYISQSFQQLMQISGSIPVDGTGSVITTLDITASHAVSASYAATASFLLGSIASASFADYATTANSASHAVSSNSSLTSISSSHAVASNTSISASHAVNANTATSATTAISASHAGTSNSSLTAITATSASHAVQANNAISSTTAISASQSDNAINAESAESIDMTAMPGDSQAFIPISLDRIGNNQTLHGDINLQFDSNAATLKPYNITAGNIISASSFIGAGAGVTGVVSASHAVRANLADNLPSTARINITDITASNASFTSASIGYLRTTTGSATIIGDEYIILNADSPTQRYAGIKVYDSGSGLTGSFEWDSVDDNWMQVATNGTSAGFLTGVSGSKGSEAYPSNNTILKGTGNHTVKDSSIVDNGIKVSTTLPISASAGVTASLHGNADTATTASYAVNGENWNGIFTGSASMTGSLTVNGDTLLNYKTAPNYARKDIVTFPSFTKSASPGNGQTFAYNAFNYFNIPVAGAVNNVFQIAQGSDSDITDYGAYLSVGGARTDIFLLASGSDTDAKKTATISVLDDGDSTYAGNAVARYYGTTIEIGDYNSRDIQIGNGMNGGTGYDTRTIQTSAENMYIGAAPGLSFTWKDGTNNYSGNPTKDIEFWYTGSATFHQTSSIVSPAIVVSGSVASHVQDLTIASTTASLNCNTGDVFRLTLANATNTHLVATNINPGQVITVKVKNNATAAGTLSFNSEFAFAGATAPTVTAAVNAEDIITFQSFDSSKLYGTSVLNLS